MQYKVSQVLHIRCSS